MNKKGFTLFTALVSFVLILLTAMIVQTMIKAERDRTELISNIEEQAEMQAMADLSRAEALQTFNYSLRKTMESYFFVQQNEITIYPLDDSFNEMKERFGERFFGAGGGTAFTEQISNALIESWPQKRFVGPYEISIVHKGKTSEEQRRILTESLQKMFEKSVDSGNFFEVVECENGNPKNCIGTFYLNLKIEEISEETYESFPQIKIYNPRTDRVLQESIFPKGNIKIYIPIRLFKALAESRALALEFEKEEANTWKENYGLFSLRIHNEIEEMKLGFCDPGYCNIRKNPFVSPLKKNMDVPCPSGNAYQTQTEIFCSSSMAERGMCTEQEADQQIPVIDEFLMGNRTSEQQALRELTARRLCEIIRNNYSSENYLDPKVNGTKDEFILDEAENISSSAFSCMLSNQSSVSIKIEDWARNSVKINQKGINSIQLDNATEYSYGANVDGSCPMEWGNAWGKYGIGLNEQGEVIQKTSEDSPCFSDFSDNYSADYGTCTEVTKVEVNIAFKEKNKNYIIDKTKEPVYVIKIVDNKFTPNSTEEKFHQTKQFFVNSTTCGLQNETNNSCNRNEWICERYEFSEGTDFGIGESTGGCKPLS